MTRSRTYGKRRTRRQHGGKKIRLMNSFYCYCKEAKSKKKRASMPAPERAIHERGRTSNPTAFWPRLFNTTPCAVQCVRVGHAWAKIKQCEACWNGQPNSSLKMETVTQHAVSRACICRDPDLSIRHSWACWISHFLFSLIFSRIRERDAFWGFGTTTSAQKHTNVRGRHSESSRFLVCNVRRPNS